MSQSTLSIADPMASNKRTLTKATARGFSSSSGSDSDREQSGLIKNGIGPRAKRTTLKHEQRTFLASRVEVLELFRRGVIARQNICNESERPILHPTLNTLNEPINFHFSLFAF